MERDYSLTRSECLATTVTAWRPYFSLALANDFLVFLFFILFLLTADVRKLPVSPAAKRDISQIWQFGGRTMCMIPTPYHTFRDCRSRGSPIMPQFSPKLRRSSSARGRVAQTRQFTGRTTKSKLRVDDFLGIFCE